MAVIAWPLPLATAVGADDSATATVVSGSVITGELVGVAIVQSASPDAATVLTFSWTNGNTPVNTFLTLTSYATVSKTIYPLALAQGTTGADLTAVYTRIPIDGYVKLVVTLAKSAQTVQAYLLMETYGGGVR